MRYLKWVSVLTVLAMLFAMLPATVAEDELVIDMKEPADEEFGIEIEKTDIEGLEVFEDPALLIGDENLELEDPEGNHLNSEMEEQDDVSAVGNASAEFEIDEEGTLTRYGGFASNVVIPYGVKMIGDRAFQGYTGMKSVSIPDSVTYIGWYAFDGCTGLKSVVIPKGVETIYFSAFSGCTSLTDVTLPDTLKNLYSWAFSGCTSLRSIVIPSSVTFNSFGEYIFGGCTSLKNIQLPSTLTELPEGMFSNCDSLDNLNFLSGITKIGDSLLSGCDGLKNITIPGSVTSIGSNAFANCENLEGVTIHSDVTFIDRTAFDGSDNVVIRGTEGSTAERYAHGVGIPFNAPVVTLDEDVISDYVSIGGEYQRFEGLILYINQNRTLNAIQKPANLARTLVWSSSDNNVATVDQNGTVKAVSQGMVTITASTADGKGKPGQITIFVPAPTSVELSYYGWSGDRTVILHGTSTISVSKSVPYQYITKVDMPITWSSSDSSIISVEGKPNDEATLKANKLGKATITATTPDGGSASVELEVIRPKAEGIKIDQSGPIQMYTDEQIALTTTLTPVDAEPSLTWDQSDFWIARVDQNGVVTGISEGVGYIYVWTDNGWSDSIEINVIRGPESITLSKKKVTLGVKEKLTLKPSFSPEDTSTSLTWKSSKPTVASISKKGKVVAKKPGKTVITITTANGKTAKCTVTVKAAPKKVTLNKSGTVTLKQGKKLKLKATLPKDTASALTWKSSKPKVASVDQNGNVRAHGSRMNRKQDFLKIIVIIAATPATSGDRELIVHAL